jgi:uncharacterized protein (TIGR00730 family)
MNTINKNHFRVAIYGSARTKPNEKAYKLVHQLAKLVAKEGFDIVTGGGPGLMDAASRGHHAGSKGKKVHSVGLTVKLPKEQFDGYHLDIKKDFNKFSKRLDNFMKYSNVFVVAPGGVGTVLEFFYTWQLMQVNHTCNVPIILLGDMWESLLDWIKNYPLRRKLLSKKDMDVIYQTNTCHQALSIIQQAHTSFQDGGENFCLNYEKYKI